MNNCSGELPEVTTDFLLAQLNELTNADNARAAARCAAKSTAEFGRYSAPSVPETPIDNIIHLDRFRRLGGSAIGEATVEPFAIGS
jgi:hypothetical protein